MPLITPITWPPLPTNLTPVAITPEHPHYRDVRSNYSRTGSPQLVIMATTEEQAAATIRYAAATRATTGTRVPLSFRSGGHGLTTASVNDGGIILDISAMNKITIDDPAQGTVRVQAGAIWGNVATTLAHHDLVLTSGNFGDTGVGGLATSGGIGYFVCAHGLTIDRIRQVRLITADGNIRTANYDEHPDLFWAVRGGSSQVGLVTEFTFEAVPLIDPDRQTKLPVIFQQVQYDTADLAAFTDAWGKWNRHAPTDMSPSLTITRNPTSADDHYQISALNVWAGNDEARARPTLDTALTLAPVRYQRASLTSYTAVVPTPHAKHHGQQPIRLRNILADRADAQLGHAIATTLNHPSAVLVELRGLGGATHRIAPNAMAWPARHQEVFVGTWLHPRDPDQHAEAFAPLRALGTGGYGAYTADLSHANAELVWPGATGERLRSIATTYDPDGLFDQGLTIRQYG